MNTLLEFIRKHYRTIVKVLALVVSITLIVYIYPREAKFKYEFFKGKPWMHEDLIAEYNFPIYKSEAALTRERDSILKEYKPFFRYDTNIRIAQENRFINFFESYWNEYLLDNYNILNGLTGRNRTERQLMERRDEYLQFGRSLLSFIYKKGIVEATDVLEQVDNENFTIVVVKGNLAQDYSYSEVFTQKMAYEYVLQQVANYKLSNKEVHEEAETFFKNLNLNNFIQPNLFYDKATSERQKETLINEISLTSGMVQEGERIISRGEVVTDSKFRVLESLRREYELRSGDSGNRILIILGQIVLISTILIVLYLFLYHFRREIFMNNLQTFFILLLVVIFALVARLTLEMSFISFYFIPFVIVPIVIRTFFDSRLALFIYFILLMLAAFLAPNSFEFIFLNFFAGVVAIFTMTKIDRRAIFFLTSIFVALTYSILYFGLSILQEGALTTIEWINFGWFAGNAFMILLSYPLIYVFEKIFGFLSDATLLELSDTNQPLLRELAEKAPGTFQHSLQVANLSEEACRSLGGNPLLVRTAALYHDIGKMSEPLYFVENQTSGFNPHDHLNFEESAAIIIGHVSKGVEIANKHNLPEPLIDFIRTHHGTTKVQYFYRSFIKSFPEKLVDDSKFSYPGPRPFTREMAIMMMADSVEAASRSLKEIDRDKINALVEKIIDSQLAEGQFNDAPITLRDLTRIKEIFKKRLTNMHHIRVEYPKEP
jgi:putative nucleotidyltransferase with HDIG domain